MTLAPQPVTPPWSGFGHTIPPDTTLKQAMRLAKLDWTVSLRPLGFSADHNSLDDDEVPDTFNARSINTEFRGLVRDDTMNLLDVVGNRYRPTQNAEGLEFFQEFAESGEATIETMGSVRGGRIVWVLAALGGDLKLPANDGVRNLAILWLPQMQGKSIGVGRTSIRPVCMNTLMASIRQAGTDGYRQTHRLVFDKTMHAEAKRVLGFAREDFDKEKAAIKAMSTSHISREDAIGAFLRLTEGQLGSDELKKYSEQINTGGGPKYARLMTDAMTQSPGAALKTAQNTVWGWLNAVTYVVDHQIGRSAEKRLDKAWWGKTAVLKRKAFTEASAMVGV